MLKTNASALEQYRHFVSLLGGQFGDSCQAVLYALDMSREADGTAGTAIEVSGTTTEARVGDVLPAFLTTYIAENGYQDRYGYINKKNPGLVLRTSVMFIFDGAEGPIGCLCVHHNIVHIKMITSFLEELTRPDNLEDDEEQPGGDRIFAASDIQGFLDNVVSELLAQRLGGNDFSYLGKSDKLALIADLDRKGVFLVKGAVNIVAKRMNVSKFSIYNYLDEIRVIP
jgi:predicted transcriptional regulator YheO